MSADALVPVLPPTIDSFLRTTRRRLRLHAALSGAGYGLAVGLALALAVCIAAWVRPLWLPERTILYALGAIAIGIVGGLIVALTRPLPMSLVAARADAALGLRERLSTALELTSGLAQSSLAGQHLRDTSALVADRPAATAIWPTPTRNQTIVLAGLVTAVLLLLILPNPQTAAVQQQQQNAQIVQQAASQVAQVQARVESQANLDPATRAALQQQLAQLEQDLRSGQIDPAQAVARIAETEAQLRGLQDPAAAQRAAALPKLGEELGTFGATASIGQKLQSGDFAGASQDLRDFAASLPNLDPASRAAVAQKLREAAASQAATNPALAQQLQDAADALDRGDVAGAQAALNQAADQIAQTGQAAAAQNSVAGALGDLSAIKRDVANGVPPTTANATPQLPSGTPVAGNATPGTAGSPVAGNGTPVRPNGSPIAGTSTVVSGNGTPITVNGTPVNSNGTPIVGTPPPNATPVVGQGQGQGQQGQGQQGQGQGQGQGQQGQQGQGQQGQGQGQGQGSNQGQGGGYGSGSGGTQPYDPVYAPTPPSGAPGQQSTIPGQGGGDSPPTGTTPGQGANTPSGVPYDQVYQQYADQALRGIDDPNIPPELREYIRQYFTNIDPNSQNR